jgi:hypothetical protein
MPVIGPPERLCDTPGMDPKAKALIRAMKRHLAQMRRPGQLKRQLARLRLTTTDLVIPPRGRRA